MMNKRFFAALLALALALALLPGTALAATQTNVPYMKLGVPETCLSATVVESGSVAWGSGWYVVNGAVTVSARIVITGDVHLILADGAVLTLMDGIRLEGTSSLTVYGQSAGTGRLDASCYDSAACIGGNSNNSCGTLTVYGGTVSANGRCAGVGGGEGSAGNPGGGGTVTVYGGSLEAAGYYGAGIGGGKGGSDNSGGAGAAVTVYGGSLTASSHYGRAIGGGEGGEATGGTAGDGGGGGSLTVCGGTVSVQNSSGSRCIGGGSGGDGSGGATGADTVVTVSPSAGKRISVRADGGELAGSPFFTSTVLTGSFNDSSLAEFSEVTPDAPVPDTPVSNAVDPGATVPETGDSARPWLCAGLMLLALTGCIVLKKRQA